MHDENAGREETHEEKVAAYMEHAHPVLQRYYASIVSNFTGVRGGHEDKVGLLTFPNSGTSWLLKVVRIATGIRIHTEYEKETSNAGGTQSRNVFAINSAERLPAAHEPVLVKSHVAHYNYFKAADVQPKDLDALYPAWAAALSPEYCRYVRLVRNPFDNARARYHLYDAEHRGRQDVPDLTFRQFFRRDLKRYLVWHACCDRAARERPTLTVLYGNQLANAGFELTRILSFCGFEVSLPRVELALQKAPPKYSEGHIVPTHLAHYSVRDIKWVAEQVEQWLEPGSTAAGGSPHAD